MKYKYSDYCTCFVYSKDRDSEKQTKENYIWIWDEIKDKRIQRIKVESKDEAEKIMNDWLEKAPKNCICEKI